MVISLFRPSGYGIYHAIFEGELTLNTFKEYHVSQGLAEDNKIMHAMLKSEFVYIMGSDVPYSMPNQSGTNFSLPLIGDNEPELSAFFEKLNAGGSEIEPLEKSTWGDTFGMFKDKFGLSWFVNILRKRIK